MDSRASIFKVLGHLLKQAAIPFILSAAYATWVYSAKVGIVSLTEWITPFAGSFFFLMWLLGQFLRTSKQVSDSKSFSGLFAGIAEINKSVAELRASGMGGALATPQLEGELFLHAKQLVKQGSVLAGLLQGGVAFEQAVHDKANRMGLRRNDYKVMSHLVSEIEGQLGPGAQRELQVLWRLRNQIAHADEEAVRQLQQQPELIEMFERGIQMLGPIYDAS